MLAYLLLAYKKFRAFFMLNQAIPPNLLQPFYWHHRAQQVTFSTLPWAQTHCSYHASPHLSLSMELLAADHSHATHTYSTLIIPALVFFVCFWFFL